MISKNLLPPDWREALLTEWQQPYWTHLQNFLRTEKEAGKIIFPDTKDIFSAFHHCPLQKTRVVLLGQDPYHGNHQSHGLCFSVPRGQKMPPSLRNIFQELHREYPLFLIPKNGNLEKWAQQGILLLNSVLTVEKNLAASHKNRGWEVFTDAVLRLLNDQKKRIIFVLWGKTAQKKARLLNDQKHDLLKTGHPSPLSVRYFRGCGHFLKINAFLRERGEKEIEWNVETTFKVLEKSGKNIEETK